jgi:hypothetical protein
LNAQIHDLKQNFNTTIQEIRNDLRRAQWENDKIVLKFLFVKYRDDPQQGEQKIDPEVKEILTGKTGNTRLTELIDF